MPPSSNDLTRLYMVQNTMKELLLSQILEENGESDIEDDDPLNINDEGSSDSDDDFLNR